jgi:cobalt-zinc-cadmium efflux system outer membrane protein
MTRWCAAVVAVSVILAATATAQEVATGEVLTLGQALARALSREPSLRAVTADLEALRGMSLQADLRANPTASFELRQEPGGTDNATELGLEWPLELRRRAARAAVAAADVTVAEYEQAEARRKLVGDVAAAYGDAAVAARELTITDEVLEAISKQLDVVRARAAQGSTPSLDRDMVDVDARRIKAERSMQAGRADRALLRLKRLLAMPPDALLRVGQSLEELVAAAEVAPATPGDPLVTRPDVRASDARVRAADARIVAAQREGGPDVTVFGSYMRMDAGFPQQAFAPTGGLERVRGQFDYVRAGLMVTLPLWNRQQGTLAAAMAARTAAEARAESAKLTAAFEIAEARVRFEQARRAVAAYQDGVLPLARRNLETVRETYELGRATVLDVLTEQRRLLETERGYTEALREAYASRVEVDRATGDVR